eukprot:ANDGO_04020.mRNA.1 Pyrrolidone-carboxylate peptidase
MRKRVYVTGFGPFHGVPVNPTTVLVEELARSIAGLETSVLTVSTGGVEEYLASISQAVFRDPNVHFVHFGVNSSGKEVALEKFAYNNASFRVPDQAGLVLNEAPISASVALDAPCRTEIPVERLLLRLIDQGVKEVHISHDPGRFLCNYVYYRSLQMSSGRSLFVHIPPTEQVAHDRLLSIARLIVDAIADGLPI